MTIQCLRSLSGVLTGLAVAFLWYGACGRD